MLLLAPTCPDRTHREGLPARLVTLVLLVLVPATLLLSTAQAEAYEGPVHFAWTYYLALHVGFTERQAFQIADAGLAIDWDVDTGPMTAAELDMLFGTDRALYLDSDTAAWAAMVEENIREEIDRWRAQHGSGGLPGEPSGPPQDRLAPWMLGVNWSAFESSRLPIRNVWSRYHAFTETQLERRPAAPPRSGFDASVVSPVEMWIAESSVEALSRYETSFPSGSVTRTAIGYGREQATRYLDELKKKIEGHEEEWRDAWAPILSRLSWDIAKLHTLLPLIEATYTDPNFKIAEALLTQAMLSFDNADPGGVYTSDMTYAQKDRLWDLAMKEGNPGPYIHYLQDVYCHARFSNVRGHPLAGHYPDFLSHDREKAKLLTLESLQALCRFHAILYDDYESASQREAGLTFADYYPEVHGPQAGQWWRATMPDRESRPEICGLMLEPDRSAPDPDVLSHPRIAHIMSVLDRFMKDDPPPPLQAVVMFIADRVVQMVFGSYAPQQAFSDQQMAVPSLSRAVEFINRQIEQDRRTPISRAGSADIPILPASRESDPFSIWLSTGNPTRQSATDYRIGLQVLRYDFDGEARVVLTGEEPEWRARELLESNEQPYPVETVEVELEDLSVWMDEVQPELQLGFTLNYDVLGAKDAFFDTETVPLLAASESRSCMWKTEGELGFGPGHLLGVQGCHLVPYKDDEGVWQVPETLYNSESYRRENLKVIEVSKYSRFYGEYRGTLAVARGMKLPNPFHIECVVHVHGLKPKRRVYEISRPEGRASALFSRGHEWRLHASPSSVGGAR